jgi:signal transduction histidine kinase
MFGFMLESESIESGIRSRQMSEANFFGQDNLVLGTVQVSESPEYGRNIIKKVIQGWLIASMVALAVSVVIGWLVSRKITRPISILESATIRMKEGDLAARSPQLKPAELSSLADTFNQMAERIQKNVGTLRRFVSDAAHEIRTPLTALHVDLSLALVEKDWDKSAGLVSRSLDQVKRLELLTKDLLDLSKIEVENANVISERFDLSHLLIQASQIHASAAEQAGIEFQLDVPELPVMIIGNPTQIHRAVNNLMENAVKFTPEGGNINVNLVKEVEWAFITIEDNGIGVLPEEQELVFNHFYRSRNVSSYPGSGLGLAIAKAIIDNHHGEIGMLPFENKTCFFIRLKLAD